MKNAKWEAEWTDKNDMPSGVIPNQSQTWEEMEITFKKVQPNSHWKDQINAFIDAKDQEAVSEAIIFYTGSVPTFTKCCNGQVRVKAAGYYAIIGA